jgi:hypothetical protein
MTPPGAASALNGLHVVRVVVPRCEALSHPGSVCMGPRLWARLSGQA